MKLCDLEYIIKGTKGKLYAEAEGSYRQIRTVSIDSRKIEEDCLFFCTIGARSDAHNYLPDVREKGCHNVVVSDLDWANKMRACRDMNVILVDDTVQALMNLATMYMDDWKGLKKVGITGSVGKTSTKEFTYCVLSSKYRTGKTQGNLNSEFGIPLTCFSYDENIEMAVAEIGLGGGPDMKYLVDIIKPDAGIITTIGTSHLETFGNSQVELQEAKLRITSGMHNGGTLVVNSNCQYLTPDEVNKHAKGDFKLVTVGSAEDAMYRLTDICDKGIDGVKCTLEIANIGSYELALPVIGAHNLFNAAEAVAIGGVFGVCPEDAIDALARVEMVSNRLDVRRGERFVVVNDTYNASPESMKAGIDIMMASNARRRGVILGDMFELGENSAKLHASVGEYAAEKGIDFLITVGENSKSIAEGARKVNPKLNITSYDTRDEACEHILEVLEDGDVMLVKASRGMALEVLSDAISL